MGPAAVTSMNCSDLRDFTDPLGTVTGQTDATPLTGREVLTVILWDSHTSKLQIKGCA